jgi:F-type H+-transporting ATPase subunit delta
VLSADHDGAGDQGAAVVDELFALAQLVRATTELRAALSDPARSAADKASLLDDLLGDKVLPATLTLTKLTLTGTRGPVMTALMTLRETAAETLGVLPAVVHAAKPLGDEQADSIKASLASRYGRPVHVNVVHDASLVGGVLVEIGDDVIDGSISTRLAEAGRLLTAR